MSSEKESKEETTEEASSLPSQSEEPTPSVLASSLISDTQTAPLSLKQEDHTQENSERVEVPQASLLLFEEDPSSPSDGKQDLISSELEASFFEGPLWQDEAGEPSAQEEEEVLSSEEIELSFFSDGEVDLLNEEDFFFPAQSSSASQLLDSSSSNAEVASFDLNKEPHGEDKAKQVESPAQSEGLLSEEEALEQNSLFVLSALREEPEVEAEAIHDRVEEALEAPVSGSLPVSEVFGEMKDLQRTPVSFGELYTFGDVDNSQEHLASLEEAECVEIFSSKSPEETSEQPMIWRKKRSVFGRGPMTFHGNYRRFLVQLVSSLLVAAPVTFWLGHRWAVERPVQWTLSLHTALGVLACLVFYLFPYHRRRITLDDVGVVYEDELRILYVPWHDIAAIHLHAVEAFFNPYPLCYARVITERGDEFCFSNFGNYLFGVRQHVSFGDPPYPIVDMRDADMLLALMVQQIGPSDRTPDLARLRFRAQAEVEQAEAEMPEVPTKSSSSTAQAWFGIWAFTLKLGMKFVSFLPTGMKLLLQSIKPAYAGVSLGIYAVFFRWEFAFLLCVILIFHELGHVWAMMREGMRIRGVFLIPFFGAATVTDDVWPSWYAQARVNLAGPLWGAVLTFLCLLAYAVYPADFFLAVAIWGALINLLNLMPVHPLDGGRILHAIAYSLRSFWGFLGVLCILVLCVGFALYHELVLLYLLGMIGVSEFFKEFVARRRADKMALLRGHATLNAHDMLLLKSLTGINFGARSAPHFLEWEEMELKRLRLILHAPAMRSDQIAKICVASFLVAAALFGFLVFIRSFHPHAMMAIEIFR